MRILVVEDDKKIASFVVKGLREVGFAVDQANNGQEGLDLALSEPYDAVVMDLMLPKLDGLSVIEQMRQQKTLTPVIILSAKRSVDDRIKGLQSGSDDYLVKPFSFSELLARLYALLEYFMRNSGRVLSKTMIIEHVWGYDFDPQTNVVDVLVSRLRARVDRDFENKLIQTHRGIGYAIKVS